MFAISYAAGRLHLERVPVLIAVTVVALLMAALLSAYAVGMLVVFGVIHAWFYGAQGTLYASLYPARIRYTGLSTVYQLSRVYASGLTPLIPTALIAATNQSPARC